MKFLLSLLLFTASGMLVFSQTNHTKPNSHVSNPKTDGYTITGEVAGFPDGTPVSFLNQKTNAPEQQTTFKGGKFIIKGKVSNPGFIVLLFNDQPPVIPIFLDNSNVIIKGTKADLTSLTITGSPSHNEYVMLNNAFQPYTKIFSGEDYDSAGIQNILAITSSFVKKFPGSFVSPFAIIRYLQASQNGIVAEQLFNTLSNNVKGSDISLYLKQQIEEAKINPIGSYLPDFTQEDVNGKPLKLSSLRGKYVLIDFWASWCRPCRMENPNVLAVYNKFKNNKFDILGVSLDKAKPSWVDAIKMDGLNWQQVSDLKGWGNDVAVQFQIHSIPANFLLDPEGKIIAKNLRGEMLEKRLASVLK